jgi:hypothetical protein
VQADANAPVFATGELEMAADPETVWEIMADIGRWPAMLTRVTVALDGRIGRAMGVAGSPLRDAEGIGRSSGWISP